MGLASDAYCEKFTSLYSCIELVHIELVHRPFRIGRRCVVTGGLYPFRKSDIMLKSRTNKDGETLGISAGDPVKQVLRQVG